MLEVYFHAGLGKTGTKYLQFDFFPKLKNINYIPMTKFKKSKEIIKKKGEGKFLVSRECDERFEEMLLWFKEDFPDAGIILVLRRQDEWLYSQFKRMIKNGRRIKFSELFNFENTGYFKIDDLYFYEKIKFVEKNFKKKPLVLIYDELKNNPERFLDKIAKYVGADYDKSKISFKKRHSSYGEKELNIFYKLSSRIDLRPRGFLKKYFIVYPIRYPILYLSKYIPDFLINYKNIFPEKKELEKIRKFYEEDWNKCINYSLNFSFSSI
ncbi:MAG: hypothetical protein ABIM29_01595 [candidate division WOR-3 bacterium]